MFIQHKQEAVEKYFNAETEWMAAEGYAESKEVILRNIAMRLILLNSVSDKFDPTIPYLALNFFDRFISRHQLPVFQYQGVKVNVLGRVRDDVVLAAYCCLIMAWKMRDHSFSLFGFLEKRKLKQDCKKHILKMELQILKGLKWEMLPVTALCFVDFFVVKIPVGRGIKRRTLNEIIIQTQGDINFTRFRPSVIAASALLTACRFLYGNQYNMNKQILLASRCVEEGDLEACFKRTYDMCIEKQILMERDEVFKDCPQLKVRPEEVSETAETSSSASVSNRPGKEPRQEEIQDEPAESNIDPEMNFELKWMLWRSEDPEEWTVDSPIFRTRTPVSDFSFYDRTEARNYFYLCPPCSTCALL